MYACQHTSPYFCCPVACLQRGSFVELANIGNSLVLELEREVLPVFFKRATAEITKPNTDSNIPMFFHGNNNNNTVAASTLPPSVVPAAAAEDVSRVLLLSSSSAVGKVSYDDVLVLEGILGWCVVVIFCKRNRFEDE